jgi:sulfur carrier protein
VWLKLVKRINMQIIINGETKIFDEKTTIEDILKELSLVGKVMAAAVNMEIVKQDKWDKYLLQDGDKLELLDFVGGG